MDWYQIKKNIYYTNDDYIRDVIALHLKKSALKAIYNYICQTPFVSMEERFKNKICEFLKNLSCLIDDDIFLLDDVIKEKPLVLMFFKPQAPPEIIEGTKYFEFPSCQ